MLVVLQAPGLREGAVTVLPDGVLGEAQPHTIVVVNLNNSVQHEVDIMSLIFSLGITYLYLSLC